MTTPSPENSYTRRLFLQQGLTLASMATTAPLFIQRSAMGMMRPLGSLTTSQPGVPEDRVLVVVQLGGGNDGLNTVVPYFSNEYYRRRPGLAVQAPGRNQDAALELDAEAGVGLNPAFEAFKELYDDGVASVIQGVGYPNPNRSHFTSMDIWHTASTDASGNGWLGRYMDNQCNGTPHPEASIAIGRTAPLAMLGDVQKPVSFESEELFRWLGESIHPTLEDPYHDITRAGAIDDVDPDSQLGFLMRTALDAQVSSDRIREAVKRQPLAPYDRNNLAQQLRVVAAMIRDGMATRVYYVSMGGFDTHANQAGQHARLLREVGGALRSFHRDLKAQGNSGRVMTMVFSEFGRRVAQNASGGTDHGTAAPMYLVGDMVRPGLLGDHPSLTDLDGGDLKYNVDFRSVYSAVLKNWMGADPVAALGREYPIAKVVKGA